MCVLSAFVPSDSLTYPCDEFLELEEADDEGILSFCLLFFCGRGEKERRRERVKKERIEERGRGIFFIFFSFLI